MAKSTEHRILQAGLSCFNELGYPNTILQQIADRAGVSVGNLAYHYSNKVELLKSLFAQWKEQSNLLLTDLHLTPIFENFESFLQATFKLQQQFQFIYLDRLELIRNVETTKKGYDEYFLSQQNQFEILLELYRARGVLNISQAELSIVALRLRRQIDSWMRQQLMEGENNNSFEQFRQAIWFELKRYFTATGLSEYEAMEVLGAKNLD